MAEGEGGKQTEKGEGKGIDSWTGTSANVLFKAVGVAAASWLVIYELIPKSWTPWGWLRTLTRDLLLSGYVIDRLALAPFASRNLRIPFLFLSISPFVIFPFSSLFIFLAHHLDLPISLSLSLSPILSPLSFRQTFSFLGFFSFVPLPFEHRFEHQLVRFFFSVFSTIYQLSKLQFFSLSLSLPLEIFSIKLTDNLITFPFVKKFTRLVYTLLIQITFSFFKVVRHSDEGWASDSSIYIAFNTREDLWVISPFSFACWPKWRAI